VEAEVEIVGEDGHPLGLVALDFAEEGEQAAGAGGREAAEALVPEQEEAGRGRHSLDDSVEGFLLARVGDLLEAVIQREAALPAGEASPLDHATAELEAEGIAAGELVGAHDELGLGVKGSHWVVAGSEGFAGASEGDESTQAGVLFEVGDGDAVDVLVGFAGRVDAEEVTEGLAVMGRRRLRTAHTRHARTKVLFCNG